MRITIRSYCWNDKCTVLTHMNGKEMIVRHSLEKMTKSFAEYDAGRMIQGAFPYLTPTEREFMMTGMTEAEQEAFFK